MHSMDIDEIMWLDHQRKIEKLGPGPRFSPYMLYDNGECLHFNFQKDKIYFTASIALGSLFLSPASFFTQFYGLSPAQEPLTQEKISQLQSAIITFYFKVH